METATACFGSLAPAQPLTSPHWTLVISTIAHLCHPLPTRSTLPFLGPANHLAIAIITNRRFPSLPLSSTSPCPPCTWTRVYPFPQFPTTVNGHHPQWQMISHPANAFILSNCHLSIFLSGTLLRPSLIVDQLFFSGSMADLSIDLDNFGLQYYLG